MAELPIGWFQWITMLFIIIIIIIITNRSIILKCKSKYSVC